MPLRAESGILGDVQNRTIQRIELLDIPVMHAGQHGPAVVVLSSLLNANRLAFFGYNNFGIAILSSMCV
jgi:malic enzyme